MGTNAVTKGAVATTVASNVRAIRDRRGMSQQGLAARLAELGRPMQASAVAKIEAVERRVDVDDLAAIAVALNVSPARLMLPDADEPDHPVSVVPAFEVPMWSAWRWATGLASLAREGDDLRDPEVQRRNLDFVDEQPLWRRVKDQHPLAVSARHVVWNVDRALDYAPGATRAGGASSIGFPAWLGGARNAAKALLRELDRSESEGQLDG